MNHTSVSLDTKYVLGQMSRENPKDLILADQNICQIGNLYEIPLFRKINLCFNRGLTSLDGMDQVPQLREFWAYGCNLTNINGISSLTKLEVLYLQSNSINSMMDVFQGMSKLQELRLDKNKISKIEGLTSCHQLKVLDLSHNSIQTVDGLSGLQLLQELRLTGNSIRSISTLRGLPSLRELDVSHNSLKSLDGIQNLLKLEIIKAEHNQILQLHLPTYPNNSGTNISGTQSNSKEIASNPKNSGKKVGPQIGKTATILPGLEKPCISEIFVGGNRIRSVAGLDIINHSLEIFDLSFNNISDTSELITSLKNMQQLTELRLFGNPCTQNPDMMNKTVASLSKGCPNLASIDEVVFLSVDRDNFDDSASQRTPSVASEFHTWERGDDLTVASGASKAGNGQINLSHADKGQTKDEAAIDDIPMEDEEKDEDEELAEKVNATFITPKLTIKSMLTEEQIQEKERTFTNLLDQTKAILHATIFRILHGDDSEMAEAVNAANAAARGIAQAPESPKHSLPTEKKAQLSAKLISAIDKAASVRFVSMEEMQSLESSTKATSATNSTTLAPKTSLIADSESNSDSIAHKSSPTIKTSQLHPKGAPDDISYSKEAHAHSPEHSVASVKSGMSSKFAAKTAAALAHAHAHKTEPVSEIFTLSSGLNTHGSKAFVPSTQIHSVPSELTAANLATEADIDFSMIRITKTKPTYSLLYSDASEEYDDEKREDLVFGGGADVEGDDEFKLRLAALEEESEEIQQLNDALMSAAAVDYEDDGEDDESAAANRSPNSNIKIKPFEMKPKSIGYDSRRGDEDEESLVSAPISSTPRGMTPVTGTPIVRAYSAPNVRPGTGDSISGGGGAFRSSRAVPVVLQSNNSTSSLRFQIPSEAKQLISPSYDTKDDSKAHSSETWASRVEEKILGLSARPKPMGANSPSKGVAPWRPSAAHK